MKEKKEKREKKNKKQKEKKQNRFIEIIKKKWLVNTTKTFLLIAIIVAVFIGINVIMQSLELTPIDLSKDKLYTLTDESKERVKNIDKDVNIYFVGYSEDDSTLDLAKQYGKVNEKIVIEAVTSEDRPDLVKKYKIESGITKIIIECGEKFKELTDNDLVTYDTTTYETISIAEEKLTASIAFVTSDDIPKIYFLSGYSDFSLNKDMYLLDIYLENKVNEVESLDVLVTGKIPEDCDTLIITTPSKDFDDIATNAIMDYINSGKNILWMNAAVTETKSMPNVEKILSTYGVKAFDVGIIRETDTSKMLVNSPDLVKPQIEYTEITEDLYDTTGCIFINATKINLEDEETLSSKNIEKTELLNTSEKSYFRKDFEIQSDSATEKDEQGKFLVGAKLKKVIEEENEETNTEGKYSELVIYGENYFASDYQVIQNSQYGAIELGENKDLVLNTVAYLTNKEENIKARKSTGTVTYTATEMQDTVVKAIIFTIPLAIVLIGIFVWQKRRRKK